MRQPNEYQEALNNRVDKALDKVKALHTKYADALNPDDVREIELVLDHLNNIKYNAQHMLQARMRGSYVIDNGKNLHLFATPEEGHKFLGSLAFSHGNSVSEFCDEKNNVAWGVVTFPSQGGDSVQVNISRDDDDEDEDY